MVQVNIRMPEKELKKARKAADKLGVSLSAYIRLLINTATIIQTGGK